MKKIIAYKNLFLQKWHLQKIRKISVNGIFYSTAYFETKHGGLTLRIAKLDRKTFINNMLMKGWAFFNEQGVFEKGTLACACKVGNVTYKRGTTYKK